VIVIDGLLAVAVLVGLAGNATFETRAPSWSDFLASNCPIRFVALGADGVPGWGRRPPTSSRAVYAGVVEHSIDVHPDTRGQGIGRALLAERSAPPSRRHLDNPIQHLSRELRQPQA
jgi:GNAT superfamily N-acetyltransferase